MNKPTRYLSLNSLNSIFIVTFSIALLCVLVVEIDKPSLGLMIESWVQNSIPVAVDQASNFLEFLLAVLTLIMQIVIGIVELISGLLSVKIG